jgi:hypothetical protein
MLFDFFESIPRNIADLVISPERAVFYVLQNRTRHRHTPFVLFFYHPLPWNPPSEQPLRNS